MAFPKVYLFADDLYWRYDIAQDKVEQGWPKKVIDEWRRWPTNNIGDTAHAGGALNAGNGKAYFFFGREYYRFDMALDRMDVGPLSVTKYWPGVPDDFIDTGVRLDDGNACLFHGATCTRFNMRDNKALDGYPRPVVDDWPGMPNARINAAMNFGNGSIYFFVDHNYTRFDLGSEQGRSALRADREPVARHAGRPRRGRDRMVRLGSPRCVRAGLRSELLERSTRRARG